MQTLLRLSSINKMAADGVHATGLNVAVNRLIGLRLSTCTKRSISCRLVSSLYNDAVFPSFPQHSVGASKMSAVGFNLESRCSSESPESPRVSAALCQREPIPETLSPLQSTCTVSNDNQSRILFHHQDNEDDSFCPNSERPGTAATFCKEMLNAIAIDLYGVTMGSTTHHWTPTMGSYERPRLIFYKNSTSLQVYCRGSATTIDYGQIESLLIPSNPAL